MNRKILVAYASRQGSTGEVAEKIGQTLTEGGFQVNVCRFDEVNDLSGYDAIIAGSAIQGQKWLPEAMEFLRSNKQTLSSKPFAAFLVCITLGMKNAESYRTGVSGWMEPVRQIVIPFSEGLFAGRLEPGNLPFSSNGMGLRFATLFGILPKGDHRDWQAIQDWALQLSKFFSDR